MAHVDWNAAKVEYISGRATYQAIAEKYGVAFSTLEKRARAEGWGAARKKYREKTVNQALARAGAKETKRLVALQHAGTRMCAELERLMKNAEEELYTHVAVEGQGEGVSELVARRLEAVDDRKLLNVSKSIDVMSRAMRNLYDIQTSAERAGLQMAQEELRLKQRVQEAKEQQSDGPESIEIRLEDAELSAYSG